MGLIPEKLFAWLNLLRVKNLAIIALSELFVRFYLIKPFFFNYKFAIDHSLSDLEFLLFIAAILCVAAAGYIINDYFDIDIDRVNKPERMLVGRIFGRMEAFRLHVVFNAAGVLLGFLSAWLAGNIKLGFIFAVTAGVLWFYARSLKKMFLLGNILVGIVTAVAILLPLLFETRLTGVKDELILKAAYDEMLIPSVFAYALFAFITTLIREMIKDIEDMAGDSQYGCKTVPVVLGVRGAKWMIAALGVLLIALLMAVQSLLFSEEQFLKISYILIAMQLPVAAMIFSLVPAASKEDFAKLSEWMKVIMLLGILSMAVFHYVQ